MKQTILVLALGALIFSSCNTNRQLSDANTQNQILNRQVISLKEQNTSLSEKLTENDKQTTQLKKENAEYTMKVEDCQKSRDAIVQKMTDMNRILEEQGNSLREIRTKAANAFAVFKDAGIEVKYRNGLVYISVQDLLMFSSGSAKINEGSIKTLSVIADILSKYPQVSAIIVGNTDTLKVTKTYKDNWSLSTERANEIIRILRDRYGVDPARLIAAGKSEYHPVASNETPEGRAKNRNTYIIINPDLSRLWLLSQKYP
jgi:chemotaxis protein MotB